MKRNILTYTVLTLLLLITLPVSAQTVKKITLIDGDTVRTKIMLPADKTGRQTELHLAVCFCETENNVTVKLDGKRNIFGLQTSTRYRNVFKRKTMGGYGRTFMPDKLDYEVDMDNITKTKLVRRAKKTFGRKAKNKFIHTWVESDDMEAVAATKSTLVSRHMEQQFTLKAGQDTASFSLRDIFVTERKGLSARKSKKLLLTQHSDMNINFMIVIDRNPCIGKDKEINDALNTLHELQEGLATIQNNFAAMELPLELYRNFVAYRDNMLHKFPAKEINTTCEDLKLIWGEYNNCVDSLINTQREIKTIPGGDVISSISGDIKAVDAGSLLFKARQLDELTATWSLSKDQHERLIIRQQCEKIIKDAEKQTEGRRTATDEQRNAVKTFKRALEYYNQTVKSR